MMAANPLIELQQRDQSIWYDGLGCGRLEVDELARLVAADGVGGVLVDTEVSAVPAAEGSAQEPATLAREGAAELPDERLIEDVRGAADLLRPIHERTGGRDGFVSVALPPTLVHDASGTVVEALRVLEVVGRPNLMVRVPATAAGLWAIEELIAAGVSIDGTLRFSVERYEALAHAYLAGLERRVREGQPVERVASVVSFLVGRFDRLMDTLLRIEIAATTDEDEARSLQTLLGQAAIAHAKIAYATFRAIAAGPRWGALASRGAHVQRLLWGSMAPADAALGEVYYVERLIGRDTVSALSAATLAAFRDHGRVQATIEDDFGRARAVLQRLLGAGVKVGPLARLLEARGVHPSADGFGEPWAALRRGW